MIILNVISETAKRAVNAHKRKARENHLGLAMCLVVCINADGGRFLHDNDVSYADPDIWIKMLKDMNAAFNACIAASDADVRSPCLAPLRIALRTLAVVSHLLCCNHSLLPPCICMDPELLLSGWQAWQ